MKHIIFSITLFALTFTGAGAQAAGQDQVLASFDRAFLEPVDQEYDFTPILESWYRATHEKDASDIHLLAVRSFSRMMGESVYTHSYYRRGETELALAGWEEIITKDELEGDRPVIMYARNGEPESVMK